MKQRLKTMAKILAEYPGFKFNEHGSLVDGIGVVVMASSHFASLGHEPVSGVTYDARVLEPAPAPEKAHAWMDAIGGLSWYVVPPNGFEGFKPAGKTRFPQFDLVANEGME
jgi:hypothetical protein